ncbi:MAG: tetratricopeptide repeat protein [Alphaproteobacteria bacterium]
MNRYYLILLALCHFAVGCSASLTSEVDLGRAALNAGSPEVAASHFRRVAEAEPQYVADLPPLREGIWTYLGRAYYDAGKMAEAREALTVALKNDSGDFMARLYFALILLREKSTPRPSDKSFTLADILYALRERVAPKRVAVLIKERGTNFNLTSENERELRKAGADDELIEEIRISAKNRRSVPESPAQQGVREAERALKEIQTWQDHIRATEYGHFWDARKRIRTQVNASLTMIANRKTDQQEFIAGLEWIGKAIEEEVGLARRDKLEAEKRGGGHSG